MLMPSDLPDHEVPMADKKSPPLQPATPIDEDIAEIEKSGEPTKIEKKKREVKQDK